MESLLTDIQHFSLHDGPGIRTTVFFKGCPLACRWCHNPEAISFKRELLYYSTLCRFCGRCIESCPEGALAWKRSSGHHPLDDSSPDREILIDRVQCTLCGGCVETCPSGALALKGRALTVEEIVSECLTDRAFYKDQGGVTLSGGEVLMQGPFLLRLLKALKAEGLHVVLDSCGFGDPALLESVLPYTDLFYYDMKCLSGDLHKEWTGADNSIILQNLNALLEGKAPLVIRIPVIKEFNGSEEEIRAMGRFLQPYAEGIGVHLLPYHNLGNSKYPALGRRPEELTTPSKEELETFRLILEEQGLRVKIFK